TCYGYRSVEELEGAWLKHLRETKGMSIMQLAQNKARQQNGTAGRMVVRTTAPPAQPLETAPIYRGVAAGPEQQGQRFGDRPPARPGYLPDPRPAPAGEAPWWPQVPVQLGPPQFGPPPAAVGAPVPIPVSPAGFPR